MIQPDVVFKKPQGMSKIFKKYITVRQSVEKNEKAANLEYGNRKGSKRRNTDDNENDSLSKSNQNSQKNSIVSGSHRAMTSGGGHEESKNGVSMARRSRTPNS